MKKTTAIMSLTLCSALLVNLGGGVASAADYPANTEGSINWKAPTGPGEVIKPELPPEVTIDPEGGNSTSGSLRIQHVPDFNFGDQEIKTGIQTFDAKFEAYKFTGELPSGATTTDTYYMPHFVQITDERGDNSGWHLTVSATKFANGTEVLDNATITLNGQARLSNSVHDNTEIAKRVATYTGIAGTDSLVIPTNPTNASRVMETKTNTKESTTNGTQTSLVLSKDYDKDDLTGTAETLNPGVTFNKTNKDVAVLGTYKSTITWTLTDGI